jgi:hypothetical protein
MIIDDRYSQETRIFIPGEANSSRKPYRKPHLEELGALLDLTLGGSPGAGDSGTRHPENPMGSFKSKKPLSIDGDPGNDLNFKKTKPGLKP